jgi:hypothetical protein
MGKFVGFSIAILAPARLRQTERFAKTGNTTSRYVHFRTGRSNTERLQ